MGHHVVKAGVGFLNGVPNRRFVGVLLGQSSLFTHVSASDKLHSEVVSQDLRGSDLIFNDLFHSFEVALEPVHNNGFLTDIEFMGELLPERLNGSLHESLLCVDVEHAVLFTSVLRDSSGLLRELFENFEIIL